MTGKDIKDRLLKNRIVLSDVAKKLNMSHQAFSQALTAADVKSGLIEKICKAINVDLSFFYDDICNKSIAFSDNAIKDDIIESLRQRLNEKDDIIKAKDELINILQYKLHNI